MTHFLFVAKSLDETTTDKHVSKHGERLKLRIPNICVDNNKMNQIGLHVINICSPETILYLPFHFFKLLLQYFKIYGLLVFFWKAFE